MAVRVVAVRVASRAGEVRVAVRTAAGKAAAKEATMVVAMAVAVLVAAMVAAEVRVGEVGSGYVVCGGDAGGVDGAGDGIGRNCNRQPRCSTVGVHDAMMALGGQVEALLRRGGFGERVICFGLLLDRPPADLQRTSPARSRLSAECWRAARQSQ